ncbi:FirrV-1-A51 [Feldmannia irregularis virus a]|uniref:FirrV-1-A51 n=1 Tax=Feldmannia irregularis virus a TaxID=231992 RepID=Q6XM36_9PHYC|nr:FirrV-1-A51 [Feldmannia irregularis virus a]AAR26875.1 FirrV-1-A51 [Feldmannia irregularis virus a]
MATTTITWVRDSNSKYEVSSKEHLLQIMNNGTLYTNAGTSPGDFWRVDYIQTTDIDFASNSTNVVPIEKFKGTYDGDNYEIRNYSYEDPEFNTANNCINFAGLFGYVLGAAAEVKNLKLTGRWNVKGVHSSGGLLAGYCYISKVANITCSLDAGSSIEQDSITSDTYPKVGGVIGQTDTATVQGITLEGEVSVICSPSATRAYVGGIIGSANSNSVVTLLRNLATFPSTLKGGEVGGVIGRCQFATSISKCLNAMTGDIEGDTLAGGVIGMGQTGNNSQVLDYLVCSMRGNITPVGNARAGGVFGGIQYENDHTYTTLLNYMTGDITGNLSGGLIGRTTGTTYSVNTSMVAMNGYVKFAAVFEDPGIVIAHVDPSFGLTYTIDHGITTDALSGLPIDSESILPYFDLTGTDNYGTSYAWEFVFGNLPEGMTLVPKPLFIDVTFAAVSGAIAYKLTKKTTTATDEIDVATGFTDLAQRVRDLQPETEYTISLYSSTDGTTYTPAGTASATTLANVSSNYSASDFSNESGKYDLSKFGKSSRSQLFQLAGTLFSTGDNLVVPVGSGNKTTKFVKVGENTSIVGEEALFIPFNETAQSANITLSDNSTVTLSFDESDNTVEIGGEKYASGESTIVDQQKLTIVSI